MRHEGRSTTMARNKTTGNIRKRISSIKYLIILYMVFIFTVPTHAFLGFGDIVFDPSNLVENIAQVAQSMIQVRNQIKQIENMIQNTKGGATPWDSMLPLLFQLGNTLERGQAIGYAMKNLDQRFLTTFPGYQPPTDWHQQYGLWTTTSLDTLRGVLASLGVNASSFAWDASRIAQLHIVNASAGGRMAAIQAGNSIALEGLGQMQRLEQIAMMQSNAYAVTEASKIDKEAATAAKATKFFTDGARPIPQHGSSGTAPHSFLLR